MKKFVKKSDFGMENEMKVNALEAMDDLKALSLEWEVVNYLYLDGDISLEEYVRMKGRMTSLRRKLRKIVNRWELFNTRNQEIKGEKSIGFDDGGSGSENGELDVEWFEREYTQLANQWAREFDESQSKDFHDAC